MLLPNRRSDNSYFLHKKPEMEGLGSHTQNNQNPEEQKRHRKTMQSNISKPLGHPKGIQDSTCPCPSKAAPAWLEERLMGMAFRLAKENFCRRLWKCHTTSQI